MRPLHLLFALLLCSTCAFAAELDASDAGVHAVLDGNGQPSHLAYRFTLDRGTWRGEGREGQGAWKDISCDQGCRYVAVTAAQAESHLPPAARARLAIACVQNTAQAFCKYTERAHPEQGGHVEMARVTDPPTPMFLRRIQ